MSRKQTNKKLEIDALQAILDIYQMELEMVREDRKAYYQSRVDALKAGIKALERQREFDGKERWVVWIEPIGPNNEPVYNKVPESTAIAVAKMKSEKSGFEYSSDEEALKDFMVVTWAWFGDPEPDEVYHQVKSEDG